jgi:fructose-1-phosphate kinase PfkB-like protein
LLTIQGGGKGINISRQLNALQVTNLALTFTGGHNGKLFREALEKEQINYTSIRTLSENREASILIDLQNSKTYSFFSNDCIITEAEAEEFKLKLEKIIRNCEIVVFSGSSPSEAADSIFPFGIEIANKYDKISVCDTYGTHFIDCIEKSPTIIHNNISELVHSLNVSLDTEKEKTDILNYFYGKGIKQVYLTDGASETYASNFDYHFKVLNARVQEIDATGSGDSFTAGIVYGWYKDLTFEQTLSLASALGSVNACKLETSKVKFEETESLINQIKIVPLGKRIKLIDVTPH